MQENNRLLDQHVGFKIKERRKTLGLTQAELSEILGLSHQQVQRYECGENTISMSRMLEIAHALNCKMEYFYSGLEVAQSIGSRINQNIISKNLQRPMRILMVEDNSADELLMQKALAQCDVAAELHVIQNPLQVMEYLAKMDLKIPDIILLDINLPRLSGLELLKKIKGNTLLRRIPVLVFSNSVRAKDMLDAYENHANGFIQKNSDLHAFYNEIRLILKYWSEAVVLPTPA